VPFDKNLWFQQQVFNSAILLDQTASQVPAGNWDDPVQNSPGCAHGQVDDPQHPMLVNSDILMGTNPTGTTVSPNRFGSGDSQSVVCQEVHDEFFENDTCVAEVPYPYQGTEHTNTGSRFSASYTVKNTFIDVTDPDWRSVRDAAKKFRTEQPVSVSLQRDTRMKPTGPVVQGFKEESHLCQCSNTSSSAKVEHQYKGTGLSSRTGETSFFKQLMSATKASDLLSKSTSSSKSASSALQPIASHKKSVPETSGPFPGNRSLATEVQSGACFRNGNLSAAVRSDISVARQQMPSPGLCEAGPSELMEHMVWTEKTETLRGRPSSPHKSFAGTQKVNALISEDGCNNTCLADTHGQSGNTLFGHLPHNSKRVAAPRDLAPFECFTAESLDGSCSPHPGRVSAGCYASEGSCLHKHVNYAYQQRQRTLEGQRSFETQLLGDSAGHHAQQTFQGRSVPVANVFQHKDAATPAVQIHQTVANETNMVNRVDSRQFFSEELHRQHHHEPRQHAWGSFAAVSKPKSTSLFQQLIELSLPSSTQSSSSPAQPKWINSSLGLSTSHQEGIINSNQTQSRSEKVHQDPACSGQPTVAPSQSMLPNVAKLKVKNTFIEACETEAAMETTRLTKSKFWSDEPSNSNLPLSEMIRFHSRPTLSSDPRGARGAALGAATSGGPTQTNSFDQVLSIPMILEESLAATMPHYDSSACPAKEAGPRHDCSANNQPGTP